MNNMKQPGFWKKGRLEQKRFYSIKLKLSTNIITFVFGLLTAALILLPLILLIIQSLKIYSYNGKILIPYFTFLWILLAVFNGLSNYFTVKLAQSMNKDMISMQEIKTKFIFFYQVLNPGFALATIFIIGFIMLKVLGG